LPACRTIVRHEQHHRSKPAGKLLPPSSGAAEGGKLLKKNKNKGKENTFVSNSGKYVIFVA
jgi:hypothetical protein